MGDSSGTERSDPPVCRWHDCQNYGTDIVRFYDGAKLLYCEVHAPKITRRIRGCWREATARA